MIYKSCEPKFGNSFNNVISFVIIRPSQLIVFLFNFQNFFTGLWKKKNNCITYFREIYFFTKISWNQFRSSFKIADPAYKKKIVFTYLEKKISTNRKTRENAFNFEIQEVKWSDVFLTYIALFPLALLDYSCWEWQLAHTVLALFIIICHIWLIINSRWELQIRPDGQPMGFQFITPIDRFYMWKFE